MSSFAKIGLNGKVIEVQSVVYEVLHDSNGVEQESIGIDFLTSLQAIYDNIVTLNWTSEAKLPPL